MQYTNSVVASSRTSSLSTTHLSVIAPMFSNRKQTKRFSVVCKGKIPGIYDTGEDCKLEDWAKSSTPLEDPLEKSSKPKRSRNKLNATDSNEASALLEERLEKSYKSKRSRKKPDVADSSEDLLKETSQIEECLEKSSKSRKSRKKLDAEESNEDLSKAFSLLDEPPKKSSKTRRSRNKSDAADSSEDFPKVSSLLEEIPEKSSKSRGSRKKPNAADSNKDFLQASSSQEQSLKRSSKSKTPKKKADDLLKSSASLDNPLNMSLKSRRSRKKAGVSDSHEIQDLWKTKHANIAELSEEAKKLKSKFKSFRINHIYREFNSEADALANAAVKLQNGEWLSSKGESGAKEHFGLEISQIVVAS